MHNLGIGPAWNSPAKKHLNMQRMSNPLSILYYPSRRPAIAYPWMWGGGQINSDPASVVGRADYAANGGDSYTSPSTGPCWTSVFPDNTDSGPASPAKSRILRGR